MKTPTPESVESRRSFLKMAAVLGTAAAATGPRLLAQGAPSPALSDKADVKITDVRCYPTKGRGGIFVEVTSDAGVSGWGECSGGDGPLMKQFIEGRFKRQIVGQNAFAIRPLWDLMYFESHDLGPSGAQACAIAGVDIALWDLSGRLLKMPIYKLLGGKYRNGAVKAYGSIGVSRWSMPVDEVVRRSTEFVAAGLTALKIRMQIREHFMNPSPDQTFAYMGAVRKAVGDKIELMVDANNGYTAQRAISTGLKLYETYGVKYFEDPVSDQNFEELGRVTAALDNVEIIAGEMCYNRWQINDLIRVGQPDIINPDVCKACGITEMDRIATISQCHHVPLQPHNTTVTICTAASLHCLAAVTNAAEFLECTSLEAGPQSPHRFFHNRVRIENGTFHVPEGPGHGLEINAEAVKAAAG